MQPEERDPASLWDMLDAARGVVRILGSRSLAEFTGEDEVVRLAVERKLEVLGEAARRVSESLRRAHPEIPWKEIVGLRNVISHQYEKVDPAEIFRIVREEIPGLIAQIEPLIPPLPPEDDG